MAATARQPYLFFPLAAADGLSPINPFCGIVETACESSVSPHVTHPLATNLLLHTRRSGETPAQRGDHRHRQQGAAFQRPAFGAAHRAAADVVGGHDLDAPGRAVAAAVGESRGRHVLVRAADAAVVPDPAVDAARRLGILAGADGELRAHHRILLADGGDPAAFRDRPDARLGRFFHGVALLITDELRPALVVHAHGGDAAEGGGFSAGC